MNSYAQLKQEYSQILNLVKTSIQYYQNIGLTGMSLNLQPCALPCFSTIEELSRYVSQCQGCLISLHRPQAVAGEGDPASPLVFVGRSPGITETARRKPFQGEEGALLDRILAAIGLSREKVYLTYAVKCPLPESDGHTFPLPRRCRKILLQELQLVKPKVICTLDTPDAAVIQAVLGKPMGPLPDLRGKIFPLQLGENRIRIIPTYSPGHILHCPEERQGEEKKLVWQDMQLICRELPGYAVERKRT
ncbi:MAG: uracil-DNA glycosylase [bacterium]